MRYHYTCTQALWLTHASLLSPFPLEDFNEPYYRSYIGEDFGKMFTELGLKCGMKVMASTTKTLSFRKPAPVEAPSSAAATAAAALEDAGPPAGDPNLN